MPITITATPGSASANSYISSADADIYLSQKYATADKWAALTADQKAQLLITATRNIETYVFGGKKSSTTQALQWPRQMLTDRDGRPIPTDSIPVNVQYAQCEMADWILTEEDRMLTDIDLQQVDQFKAGPLDIKVKAAPVVIPPSVKQLLSSVGPSVLITTEQGTSSVSFCR